MKKKIGWILAAVLLVGTGCGGDAKAPESTEVLEAVIEEAALPETEQESAPMPEEPEEPETVVMQETIEEVMDPFAGTGSVMYTTERVNLRAEQNTDSEILKTVDPGAEVMAFAPEGEWIPVVIDESLKGYIKSEYLTDSIEAAEEAAAAIPAVTGGGRVVVIDAGHQAHGDSTPEPIGPGAAETKAKVASGTSGVVSGLAEYQLTMMVSEKLKDQLTARGYQVIMCRESNDVNISNSERAAIANNAGAGAFIRVHANGSTNSSANGVMTICQTPSNPYNSAIYPSSRRLSDCVLDGVVAATGAKKEYVWETDTMSGINWCQVPVTILEMGYMSNPSEDALMATEDYQNKIAIGAANGIDAYFGN